MKVDVLVIGSGIAGLVFSLKAAQYGSVAIVTKKGRLDSSTNYAQGGIAAVFDPDDTPDLHVADTLVAGAGLCHGDMVRLIVDEGPARVRELIDWDVQFTRDGGELSLGREGGHSRRRVVRADDLTGREIERALIEAVAASPDILVLENHAALDLLTVGSGPDRRCCGAMVLPPQAQPTPFIARAVLLATGGCGQVYRHTTNPEIATGDGVAIAFRVGARVANLEFVQFHPTALYPADGDTLLISEAVREEGAVLLRSDGSSLMRCAHRLGSLAPRGIVARAIDQEMKRSGSPHALLDCTGIPATTIRTRFPNILRATAERGIDMLREPLPVVPVAHYSCGGVATDADGQTSLAGLFAAGETACTGVHGANRPASNSLLEAIVFADRAARRIRAETEYERIAAEPELPEYREFVSAGSPGPERHAIRDVMWEEVGIVRTDAGLTDADARISQLRGGHDDRWIDAPSAELAEVRNLAQVAQLIVRSARARKESRGLHFNRDHPRRDNERFLRDTVLIA